MSQNFQDGPQPLGPRPESATPASGTASHSASHPGQAYSPLPSSNSARQGPTSTTTSWSWVALGVVIAGGIIAGTWYAISDGSGPGAPSTVSAPAVDQQQKTFPVGAVDADIKATEQLKAILSGASAATVAADDLRAINSADLKTLTDQAPAIAADIQTGRRVLYRVYLLDFLAEDGDYVDFSVDGISLGNIAIKGAGTSFLIPLAAGMPARLKVLATADGGGGVTVGFISSIGEARTRVLQLGDFDEWQVIVQ